MTQAAEHDASGRGRHGCPGFERGATAILTEVLAR
jgi:hypothetical protein